MSPIALFCLFVIVAIFDIACFVVVAHRVKRFVFSLFFSVDYAKGKGVDFGVYYSDGEVHALVFGDYLVEVHFYTVWS